MDSDDIRLNGPTRNSRLARHLLKVEFAKFFICKFAMLSFAIKLMKKLRFHFLLKIKLNASELNLSLTHLRMQMKRGSLLCF